MSDEIDELKIQMDSSEDEIAELRDKLDRANKKIDKLVQDQVFVGIQEKESGSAITPIDRVPAFHLLKPKIYCVEIKHGNNIYEFMSPVFNRVLNFRADINEKIKIEPFVMATGEVAFHPYPESFIKIQEPRELIVKSLQEQIAGLIDGRAHLDMKNQVLERNLKRATEGRAAYRVQVEQLTDQIRGLHSEIDSLKAFLLQSERKAELLGKTCVSMSDRVDSLIADANSSTREDLKRKLKKSYEKCSELSLKVGGLEESAVKLEAGHAIRVAALESGIEDQKKGLTEIQKDRDELRIKLMRSTHELEDMADVLSNEQYYRTLFQWLFTAVAVAGVVSYFVFHVR